MKLNFFYFTFFFLCYVSAQDTKINNLFNLQNGDIIFQESCSGNMNNAIKDVTQGIKGYNFTHVGMVWINSLGTIQVIEATHPKVQVTPLQEFLIPKGEEECLPISVVGRLKTEYQPLIPKAINFSLHLIDKEYDDAFNLNNDQYYCSELIYLALYNANNNEDVFPLNIMTFKSSKDEEFSPYWIEHFNKLNLPIPEGEMGINPGAMSQSEVIDIVEYY